MSINFNSLSFDNPNLMDTEINITDNEFYDDIENNFDIDSDFDFDDDDDDGYVDQGFFITETKKMFSINTIKDQQNRSKLLYTTGLYEQPFNERGELKSKQAVRNMIRYDYINYKELIRQIQPLIPKEMIPIQPDDVMKIISGISADEEAYKKIINMYGYKDNLYLKSKNYITDLIKRQAAYLQAIKSIGNTYPYADYPVSQPKSIVDSRYTYKIQKPTLPIHYNNEVDHLLEMGSFVELLKLAENTEPKSGLNYENDGLLQSLMTASIYVYIMDRRLGHSVIQHNLENCKMFKNMSTESITNEAVMKYINSIKYATYAWCIPTTSVISRLLSMYKSVRRYCKDSGEQMINLSIVNLREIIAFITKLSYNAFKDACDIKNAFFIGQDKIVLHDLSCAANKSFADLLEFIYLNCFDVFAVQLRRIYKDITIKTYEPATEFQLGGPGYFDDFGPSDANEVISRIGGILNGDKNKG